ncbi:universal stress protein [Longispora fulva]|uniref:Nucleotide-binding universal stress UspA family protein n=1 Tax=Longispora fulva TaxID=619741 RepID=A0A8J7KMQ4_9ACTN|nr:universal stress protein [Longispora fulva]MBG6134277.1 nucleotide-binding universal stress UspA family protein [Longispora fulva]GIG62992.1 universal stress protein [Longispora fulva]
MTDTSRRVVAGIDGSPDSFAALDLAAEEARARGVPLHLVCAYVSPLLYIPYSPPVIPGADEPARKMVHDTAERIRLENPGLTVVENVVQGGGAAILVDESHTADLVVVGCRGRGGFTGLLAGSVSAQLAAHASCPVIVVRPAHPAVRPEGGHVVVGVDASPECGPAVEFAFIEAARRRVPLTAAHVWSHLPVTAMTADAPISYSYAQAHEDAERVIAESVAGWAEKYPDVEVLASPILAEDAGAELVAVSEHAGLLVVGSRGRGELAGMVLGSVGYTLVHHALCPVAIVRRRPARNQTRG